MDDPQHVAVQYADPINLAARADLHSRFSTNPYGWSRWVMDHVLAGEHGSILEVGGGPGNLWASEGSRLRGDELLVLTDLSPGMVAEARDRTHRHCRYAVASAQSLPVASSSFDVVVANHMLYHVPDRHQAVAEFARVLVPGGRLLAATNGPHHMSQLSELLNERDMISEFDLRTGGDLLAEAFEDISIERYEDSLRVTDADAVVAYAASMREFWPAAMSPDEMRDRVRAVIERDGAFTIDKDPGLFTAVRR